MAADNYSLTKPVSAVIAAGAAVSAPVSLPGPGFGVICLDMPLAWVGAPITFRISRDGTLFRDYYVSVNGVETEVVVAASANHSIGLDPTIFGPGFTSIQLRSGTGASPVNQTAGAIIGVITRPF